MFIQLRNQRSEVRILSGVFQKQTTSLLFSTHYSERWFLAVIFWPLSFCSPLVFSSRCLPIFHDFLSQIGQDLANLPADDSKDGHA
jgi:hypothetical protein